MESNNKILPMSEIKLKIEDLGRIINIPDDLMPTFGYILDGSKPAVLVDDSCYRIVLMERGDQSIVLETSDLDLLMYRIFHFICSDLGLRHEKINRVKGQDFRRIYFAKIIDLMNKINPEWGMKTAAWYTDLLKRVPYDDLRDARVNFAVALREKGIPNDEIEKIIFQKYPRPKPAS